MIGFKNSRSFATIVAGLGLLVGTSAFGAPGHSAQFYLERGDANEVIATVILAAGMPVDQLMIDGNNVLFPEPIEVEPGVWETVGVAMDSSSCHEATATVVVSVGMDAPDKSSKKSSHKASKKSSHKSSHKASHKSSHKSSHKASHKSSHKASDKSSHKASKKSSHKASEKSSHKASKKSSKKSSTKGGGSQQFEFELTTEICEIPEECSRPILTPIPW